MAAVVGAGDDESTGAQPAQERVDGAGGDAESGGELGVGRRTARRGDERAQPCGGGELAGRGVGTPAATSVREVLDADWRRSATTGGL